ncbi:MAG: SLC13 family permease [Gammaproteobacteria bacterium]
MPITLPDAHGMIALGLTLVALILFSRDRIPLETSAIVVLTALVLVFEIFPYARDGVVLESKEFFHGFGHEALITIAGLMILGKGMETTGVLQPLALAMARAWNAKPRLALLATLISVAVLSAFLNNTPIVIMLLPILITVSMRSRIPSSGILMPVGLATTVGGMGTAIGTSTNLLVISVAADIGLERFGMFDFSVPVMIVGTFGILYLWLVAPHMLPEREPPMADTSPRIFKSIFFVTKDSYALGKTLAEIRDRTEKRMTVNQVQRADGLVVAKLPSLILQEGDRLRVSDTREHLKEFERLLGVSMHGVEDGDERGPDDLPTSSADQQMAEVVVTTGSPLHQRTLNTSQFRARYRLLPLAIHRARSAPGEVSGDFEDVLLRAGDVILVQGSSPHIAELKRSGNMLVLDGTMDLPHTHRAPWALTIMALVVILAGLGILPIMVSALLGATIMVLTGCLSWRDAFSSITASVVLIIVTSLALGHAILSTGADSFLAQLFVVATSGLSSTMTLSALMILLAVMTNVVSNNAAAVIGTPIAVSIAQQLGLPPEPFVLAVLFGANMSFATPIGYQTNLLLYSAGGYKFSDFMRVGIPLTLIMWVGFTFVLSWIYSL